MVEPGICFVCGNIYPLLSGAPDLPVVGGAEVQQYLIGQGLRRCGFPISYVTEEHGQGPTARVSGFPVFSFRLGRNKVVQALTLVRALWRAGAAVYYVRDMPKYGALIYLFCRATGRKIVQAVANDVEVEPEYGDSPRLTWAFRVHAAWRRRADLVIAQTPYQAERLQTRWHVAAVVVPSLVPVDGHLRVDGHPAAAPRSPDQWRVLWVGRMTPAKRPAWLVDIARQLPDMQFVVVGGRAREAPSYYEAMAPLLRACANVRWLGFVPYARVGELFRSASVLLHTTAPGREGFPNVFLQAWAAGLPVISTSADPNHLLTQGGLGLLAHTADEAAAALRRLAADPAQRDAIGARGQAYVWETHRPEAVLPRLSGLLRALAGSG